MHLHKWGPWNPGVGKAVFAPFDQSKALRFRWRKCQKCLKRQIREE